MLKPDEQELHINVVGSDRHTAEIFTDDPIWIKRLNNRFKPYKVVNEVSYYYSVPIKSLIRVHYLLSGDGEPVNEEE